jgi:hypothetical protein
MLIRYCVNCEEEFRPEILRCSDCGGELEDRHEEEDGEGIRTEEPERRAPAVEEPPGEYHAVFNTMDSASLKEAAESLAGAGVQFRASGYRHGFQLLVRSEQLSAARGALEGLEGTIVADDSEPPVGFAGGVCPACGAGVPAGVLECPGCALVVGAEPARCASCGSLLGPADVQCPVCRAPEG